MHAHVGSAMSECVHPLDSGIQLLVRREKVAPPPPPPQTTCTGLLRTMAHMDNAVRPVSPDRALRWPSCGITQVAKRGHASARTHGSAFKGMGRGAQCCCAALVPNALRQCQSHLEASVAPRSNAMRRIAPGAGAQHLAGVAATTTRGPVRERYAGVRVVLFRAPPRPYFPYLPAAVACPPAPGRTGTAGRPALPTQEAGTRAQCSAAQRHTKQGRHLRAVSKGG